MNITIERNTMVLECSFDYKIWPGCKGSRGSFGEQLEPDDPPEIEVWDVNILNISDGDYFVEESEWFTVFEPIIEDYILEKCYSGDFEL